MSKPTAAEMALLPPEQFTRGPNEMLAEACPSKDDAPFFRRCMSEAKAKGMTWARGLENAIESRRGMLN